MNGKRITYELYLFLKYIYIYELYLNNKISANKLYMNCILIIKLVCNGKIKKKNNHNLFSKKKKKKAIAIIWSNF